MKKLAVLIMIPALAMLMVPALASANWYYWWGIQGTWEMSSSGSCLHSSLPYEQINGKWTAPASSQVYAGVTVANGTWTFESTGWLTGKGAYSQTIYATILPGGAKTMPGLDKDGNPIDLPVPLEVRVLPSSKEFTYEITPSGDITVIETANGVPTGNMFYGSISIDKKTMTLLSANHVQEFWKNLFANTICNFARTLIKVGH